MGENPFLWVSFQTNPLLDFTRNLGSFESEFEKLTKTLGRLGFHIAEMSSNMRNSKQIGQLAKEAKVSSGLGSGFRGKIPILNVHSTVNSQTPTHIPMNQDDCGKLVVPALGYALNVINPNEDKSFCCVVLHGDALMSSDIKDCLVAIGVEEKDVGLE